MSLFPTPMLFLPPRPPIQLPTDGVVVIGRSSEAELRVADADTSRRHAKIVCQEGRFTLYDLASTNGTHVNGERIEQHELRAGDRIRVGENEITFCQVEAELEGDPDDSATLFREEPSPGATGQIFNGDLAVIPPYAVLQILELGCKTGLLFIEGRTAGRIWLQRGNPVHAETKGQVGFDAAVSLVNADVGGFAFEPLIPDDVPEATIEASVTQLLLEASRLQDEEAAKAESLEETQEA
ncbi:MAG: FHA domain-containing protein [Myxococcota bacterium]